MPGPGRPPNPPPREFYVVCWKCRARIFFETTSPWPFKNERFSCPVCGAVFIIRRTPRPKKAARRENA